MIERIKEQFKDLNSGTRTWIWLHVVCIVIVIVGTLAWLSTKFLIPEDKRPPIELTGIDDYRLSYMFTTPPLDIHPRIPQEVVEEANEQAREDDPSCTKDDGGHWVWLS